MDEGECERGKKEGRRRVGTNGCMGGDEKGKRGPEHTENREMRRKRRMRRRKRKPAKKG